MESRAFISTFLSKKKRNILEYTSRVYFPVEKRVVTDFKYVEISIVKICRTQIHKLEMNRNSVFILVQVQRKLSFSHRGRIDIMANILREAVGGAKKTHIMYRCNLSFRQLQTYLDLLIDRKLLKKTSEEESGNVSFYETTPKGRAFLEAYSNIKVLLNT